ncbi:RNB domain-containing ribonuclease [Rhodococcoides yunnanense]|uniref:RNB domain-containing ribonuclease n=1 Tax=Rhodococcoides yunnanense TaxID=278209 RepID=A0ABU4BDC5_9NOCA|nr:RNB domain-containing ribonuclease [Rhodococcus yunnanensis]MDV6262217.1 RNB domain-containing ribonuclease [Rhodococcus yunnanensis]
MLLTRLKAPGFDFAAIRSEFALTEAFDADVMREAVEARDLHADSRIDRTDIPFVTIDPPGSKDLDQAVHIEKTSNGLVVHYAIADVGALVIPGGALDAETRRRGQTFYLPDGSVPLHPRELSEGSGSLLEGQTRCAALWTIELDDVGEAAAWTVTRALVRSTARLDYAGVQADVDAGTPHPSIAALAEFGAQRAAAARRRGAVDITLPEQEVVPDGQGWRIVLQPRTAVDGWNAEVSLLTGMCAARIMLDAGTGIVRTLPPAPGEAVETLKRTAAALGIDWPAGASAGAVLAGLSADKPSTLAMMSQATGLLRGADYLAFDRTANTVDSDASVEHSGIGAPYAHVTAPLRRLSDRFATEVCLAVVAGSPVPEWATQALPELPAIMRGSDSAASKVDRACVDLTEAHVLKDRVGETFDAVVLRGAEGKRDAEVLVSDPIVIGKCDGEPPAGESVTVRLTQADTDSRKIAFGYSPVTA